MIARGGRAAKGPGTLLPRWAGVDAPEGQLRAGWHALVNVANCVWEESACSGAGQSVRAATLAGHTGDSINRTRIGQRAALARSELAADSDGRGRQVHFISGLRWKTTAY